MRTISLNTSFQIHWVMGDLICHLSFLEFRNAPNISIFHNQKIHPVIYTYTVIPTFFKPTDTDLTLKYQLIGPAGLANIYSFGN